MGEILYNSIELPENWPPLNVNLDNSQPQNVPYLDAPPAVADIDVGRQLLVDDFLVAPHTSMKCTYHTPVKYPGNPVFFPQTEDELRSEYPPCAIAKSGGVWFDVDEQIFKMWYMSGYLGYVSYATSLDGIHWQRPELDVVPGTNHVLPQNMHPDSGSVVIDYNTENPDERYKMLLREGNPPGKASFPAMMLTSPDGIHWGEPKFTGDMHDRSTFFYNPFRKKWVQSIRWWHDGVGRVRYYNESDNFYKSGEWEDVEKLSPWLRADSLDESFDLHPECYNLDAIAYESIMVGFPQILKGPPNPIGERYGLPKLTELTVAFSRDGFHWHRPNREAFIGARREPGSWEYGYVESSAGMCLVVGDELWFYYSAYAGDPARTADKVKSWHYNGTYANGAVGLAKLRRDGFASMSARFPGAQLVTRPVKFSGKHLFVNANTAGSALRVEVSEANGEIIEGFNAEDCIPSIGNSTCTEIRWKNSDLGTLAGRPVKFTFRQDRGELYSFWVSKTPDGKSEGYLGAGGPSLR